MTLFDQLDEVLRNQLDPLMETLQDASTAFYNADQTARAIVDSAATHEVKPAPAPSVETPALIKAL